MHLFTIVYCLFKSVFRIYSLHLVLELQLNANTINGLVAGVNNCDFKNVYLSSKVYC